MMERNVCAKCPPPSLHEDNMRNVRVYIVHSERSIVYLKSCKDINLAKRQVFLSLVAVARRSGPTGTGEEETSAVITEKFSQHRWLQKELFM